MAKGKNQIQVKEKDIEGMRKLLQALFEIELEEKEFHTRNKKTHLEINAKKE